MSIIKKFYAIADKELEYYVYRNGRDLALSPVPKTSGTADSLENAIKLMKQFEDQKIRTLEYYRECLVEEPTWTYAEREIKHLELLQFLIIEINTNIINI